MDFAGILRVDPVGPVELKASFIQAVAEELQAVVKATCSAFLTLFT